MQIRKGEYRFKFNYFNSNKIGAFGVVLIVVIHGNQDFTGFFIKMPRFREMITTSAAY